jgi:hypothetical protein
MDLTSGSEINQISRFTAIPSKFEYQRQGILYHRRQRATRQNQATKVIHPSKGPQGMSLSPL